MTRRKYKNFEVLYDEKIYNDKTFSKISAGITIATLACFILIFAIVAFFVFVVPLSFFGVTFSLVIAIAIMALFILKSEKFIRKHAPVHYLFFDSIKDYKPDELEFGAFNGVYGFNYNVGGDIEFSSLEKVMGKSYVNNDIRVDTLESVYAIFDCTSDIIYVTIQNTEKEKVNNEI